VSEVADLAKCPPGDGLTLSGVRVFSFEMDQIFGSQR
jgi:hypothetical protein